MAAPGTDPIRRHVVNYCSVEAQTDFRHCSARLRTCSFEAPLSVTYTCRRAPSIQHCLKMPRGEKQRLQRTRQNEGLMKHIGSKSEGLIHCSLRCIVKAVRTRYGMICNGSYCSQRMARGLGESLPRACGFERLYEVEITSTFRSSNYGQGEQVQCETIHHCNLYLLMDRGASVCHHCTCGAALSQPFRRRDPMTLNRCKSCCCPEGFSIERGRWRMISFIILFLEPRHVSQD